MTEPWKKLYWQTKATAKKLRVPFEITEEWFRGEWDSCMCGPSTMFVGAQSASVVVCRRVAKLGFTEDNCYLALKIIWRSGSAELTKTKNLIDGI